MFFIILIGIRGIEFTALSFISLSLLSQYTMAKIKCLDLNLIET